jgi:hypothetical protein
MNIIILAVFLVYNMPMWKLRYLFRSIVYRDFSWKINIKPVFFKEIWGIFSNKYFKNKKEIKLAWVYRLYLIGYFLLLFLTWRLD